VTKKKKHQDLEAPPTREESAESQEKATHTRQNHPNRTSSKGKKVITEGRWEGAEVYRKEDKKTNNPFFTTHCLLIRGEREGLKK